MPTLAQRRAVIQQQKEQTEKELSQLAQRTAQLTAINAALQGQLLLLDQLESESPANRAERRRAEKQAKIDAAQAAKTAAKVDKKSKKK